MSTTFNALHCEGIRSDTLGHYLAGLGLLAATSRKWAGVRGWWQKGYFALLGQELDPGKWKDYSWRDGASRISGSWGKNKKQTKGEP